MRRAAWVTLVLVLIGAAILGAVGYAAAAPHSGGVAPGPAARAPTRVQVGTVSFADAKHGWASGSMGGLLRTTDGGAHWTRQYVHDPSFVDQAAYNVDAVSRTICWAVGGDSVIHETTNAGRTWVRVAKKLRPTAFLGNTWWYCRFVGRTGWIVSTCGDVIATKNGGASWSWQRRAISGDDAVGGVSAANAGHAFIALNAASGHYVLATTDGKTWKQVGDRPFLWWNPDFSGIWAENADRVWLAARTGEVFLSENGGQDWRVSNTGFGPGTLVLNGIGGYGTTVCAVGRGGTSNDGAAALTLSDGFSWGWVTFASGGRPGPGAIGSIERASEKSAWAVAWGGQIWRTLNGGGTWQRQY